MEAAAMEAAAMEATGTLGGAAVDRGGENGKTNGERDRKFTSHRTALPNPPTDTIKTRGRCDRFFNHSMKIFVQDRFVVKDPDLRRRSIARIV
jgi:hypothetical protein